MDDHERLIGIHRNPAAAQRSPRKFHQLAFMACGIQIHCHKRIAPF